MKGERFPIRICKLKRVSPFFRILAICETQYITLIYYKRQPNLLPGVWLRLLLSFLISDGERVNALVLLMVLLLLLAVIVLFAAIRKK